jgi:hypothetical protein
MGRAISRPILSVTELDLWFAQDSEDFEDEYEVTVYVEHNIERDTKAGYMCNRKGELAELNLEMPSLYAFDADNEWDGHWDER